MQKDLFSPITNDLDSHKKEILSLLKKETSIKIEDVFNEYVIKQSKILYQEYLNALNFNEKLKESIDNIDFDNLPQQTTDKFQYLRAGKNDFYKHIIESKSIKDQYYKYLNKLINTNYSTKIDLSPEDLELKNWDTYLNLLHEEYFNSYDPEEKSKEIIYNDFRDLIYFNERVVPKNKTLTLKDFAYYETRWDWKDDYKLSSSGRERFLKVLKAFSCFLNDSIHVHYSLNHLLKYTEYNHVVDFNKVDIQSSKIDSIQFYKNGNLKIVFKSSIYMNNFINKYNLTDVES